MAAVYNDLAQNKFCVAYGRGIGGNSICIIFTMTISVIGIIISSMIIYHSAPKIAKNKKLDSTIKYLYIASLIAAYLLFIIALIKSILCIDMNLYHPSVVLEAFFILIYCILFCLILAILIHRLHTTFTESIFKLSLTEKCILITCASYLLY